MRSTIRACFLSAFLLASGSGAQPVPPAAFHVEQVPGAHQNHFSLSHAAIAAAVLTDTGASQPIAADAREVVIPANHLAFFKTARVATRLTPESSASGAAARVKWALPYEYTFVADGGAPRSSHLVAEVASKLRMVSGSEFRTELMLRLEDESDPTLRYALPQPAEVIVTAAVDQVVPKTLSLAETAVWKPVELSTAHPGASVDARVYSSVDSDGLALEIGIDRPTLAVAIDRPSIQGLGLETAEVTVSASGLPDPEGHEVELSVTRRGGLEDVVVPLNAQGFATTKLRSIRTGPTEVRATSPLLGDAVSGSIEFEPPWAFAISALIGGAGGAALKRLTSARRARAGRVAVAALISGVGGAVLCASGINLLQLELPRIGGEALVAGVALLFALAGLRAPSAAPG